MISPPLTRRQVEVLRLIDLGLCRREELHWLRPWRSSSAPICFYVPDGIEGSRWVSVTDIVGKLGRRRLVRRHPELVILPAGKELLKELH